MDNVVEKYFKSTKEKWLYVTEMIKGIIMFLMLFYGKGVYFSNALFCFYIILLFLTSYLLKLLVKLLILYNCFNVNLKISSIFEISKEYESYIKQSNKKYIKENILNIKKIRKEILIKYLDITKGEIGKLGIKEIIVMAIGFIVGASFVDSGELSLSNLATASFYVFALFLASSIFYFIILKIVNNYKLIMNDDVKKKELLINILEIEYEY